MKRDWDLIRKILTAVEDKPAGEMFDAEEMAKTEEEKLIVCAHVEILYDAGYVKGNVTTFLGYSTPTAAWITGLTAEGYDLLDTIRSDTVWNGIKKTAKVRGLDLSIEAIKQLGKFVLDKIIKGEPLPGIS